jgi:hypothetical protein
MKKTCCDEPKMKGTLKNRIDPVLLGIAAVTVLVVGGVILVGMNTGATPQVEADQSVQVSTGEVTHDWGDITLNGGLVTKSFAIENSGEVPLKLYEVKTSCMCTTAQLVTSSQSSKKFGMHDTSTSVFEVPAGETAEVLVEFDPAFHGPSGIGPIVRVVTVKTNDSYRPELEFRLVANVIN